VTQPGKSVEATTSQAIPMQATLGVVTLRPSTSENMEAQQSAGNLNCPWWVGALLLLACMACLAWFVGLHQPYIESCDVVRQNMPLLNEICKYSKSGCGVDIFGSDEDEDGIEEGKTYVASRGLCTTDRSDSATAQEPQEQYDLVTITPGGPKVLSLQGGVVPPGIPVATQLYDLITVPPQEEALYGSLNGWGSMRDPYYPPLSPNSQQSFSLGPPSPGSLGPPSPGPSVNFDDVTIPRRMCFAELVAEAHSCSYAAAM